MPLAKRGKHKKYFYEYRRDADGQVKKFYVGKKDSLKAVLAGKKEEQRRSQEEERKKDNKLMDNLVDRFNKYQTGSNLLLRSKLLLKGLYKRGSEVRKIRKNQ